MGKDRRAKQRAYFARQKRLTNEAKANGQDRPDAPRKYGRSYILIQSAKEGRADADRRQDKVQAPAKPKPRNPARGVRVSASRVQTVERRAQQRLRQELNRQRGRLETAFRDAARTKEQVAAQKAIRDAAMRRQAQHRKDDARKAFNRDLDRRRADALKKSAAIRARSVAFVAARQKQQGADQVREHRRQTDRMRVEHRAEIKSLRENGDAGIARHAARIHTIDNAERRELDQLAEQRNSPGGRMLAILKPGAYQRQEIAIADRHELSRMKEHHALERLKDRQFTVEQTSRLRQAQERKVIFDRHRAERRDLSLAQAKDRPRQVEQNRQAFQRAAMGERAQVRTQAQTQTQGHSQSNAGHTRK